MHRSSLASSKETHDARICHFAGAVLPEVLAREICAFGSGAILIAAWLSLCHHFAAGHTGCMIRAAAFYCLSFPRQLAIWFMSGSVVVMFGKKDLIALIAFLVSCQDSGVYLLNLSARAFRVRLTHL